MSIILPTASDEDRVLELALNFFKAASLPYGHVKETKARALIQRCVDKAYPDSVLIGYVADGQIQGILAGQITEVLFNEDRVASELIWWVEPAYRKSEASSLLIQAYEYWAAFNECKYVQMVGLQNDYSKVLGRYYNRKGYVNAENTFVKGL